MTKYLPITQWLPNYTRTFLQSDIIAGFSVGLMVVPQSLAYAKIARLDEFPEYGLQYGLYAAMTGVLVYIFFGTSKDVSIGPTAITSLIVGKATEGDVSAAISIAFLAGCLQLALGLLHFGTVIDFVSPAVISGFTSAAAVTIGFGQIHNLLGFHLRYGRYLWKNAYHLFKNLNLSHYPDVILGVSCIIILWLFKYCATIGKRGKARLKDVERELRKQKGHNKGPGMRFRCARLFYRALILISVARNAILMIMATLFCYIMHQYGHKDFKLLGHVPGGVPAPKPAQLFKDPSSIPDIIVPSVIIALISFLETIAIAKVFAKQNGYSKTLDPSQELVAIGASNLIGSFFNAYPVTGSFSRTAVNSQAGVKTPLAGIVTSGIVISALLFITPAFAFIPSAALAALIIAAVVAMIDFDTPVVLYHLGKPARHDFICFWVSFFGCLTVGIQYGVIMAILVSMLFMIYKRARPHFSHVYININDYYSHLRNHQPDVYKTLVDGNGVTGDVNAKEVPAVLLDMADTVHGDVLVFRVDGGIMFYNMEYVTDKLGRYLHHGSSDKTKHDTMDSMKSIIAVEENTLLSKGCPVRGVVLDMSGVDNIDINGVRLLSQILVSHSCSQSHHRLESRTSVGVAVNCECICRCDCKQHGTCVCDCTCVAVHLACVQPHILNIMQICGFFTTFDDLNYSTKSPSSSSHALSRMMNKSIGDEDFDVSVFTHYYLTSSGKFFDRDYSGQSMMITEEYKASIGMMQDGLDKMNKAGDKKHRRKSSLYKRPNGTRRIKAVENPEEIIRKRKKAENDRVFQQRFLATTAADTLRSHNVDLTDKIDIEMSESSSSAGSGSEYVDYISDVDNPTYPRIDKDPNSALQVLQGQNNSSHHGSVNARRRGTSQASRHGGKAYLSGQPANELTMLYLDKCNVHMDVESAVRACIGDTLRHDGWTRQAHSLIVDSLQVKEISRHGTSSLSSSKASHSQQHQSNSTVSAKDTLHTPLL